MNWRVLLPGDQSLDPRRMLRFSRGRVAFGGRYPYEFVTLVNVIQGLALAHSIYVRSTSMPLFVDLL